MRQPVEIIISDARIGIWQNNAQDPSFRSDIYGALIRQMRERGWSIRFDPETRHRFRTLSPDRRLGARGTLRCEISISGRVATVDFWAVTWPICNTNGRRYDFNRMQRMRHIDRLRIELEYRRIIAWLTSIAPVKVDRSADRDLPPMERIEKGYAESWHTDKALGRPICQYDHNRKSADGHLLEQGQTVWFPNRKGRIVRGTAYYNINNMWWVIAGGELFNEGCHSLFTEPPPTLRRKHNERARRSRLEGKLASAIRRMDFKRAELLKHILFDDQPTYLIWSRKREAYYRANCSGYTSDAISAGRYTREEAEAECRRVPHLLDMVTPDGKHIRFDKEAA